MRKTSKRLVATLLTAFSIGCSATRPVEEAGPVFYPQAPDPPRVQFLRTVSMDTDVELERSGLDDLLFGEVTVHRGFMAPYGATVHEGIVYVCDIQQGVIVTIDFTGKALGYIPLEGRGRLEKPVNLMFDEEGGLFVADLGRRQIIALAPDLSYRDAFGPFGEESRLTDISGLGDELFVTDPGSRCIRVLDKSTGEQLRLIADGTREGPRPRAPTNIAVDADGRLYVVDSLDCQVTVWTTGGDYVKTIGSPGNTVGQFARPKGIALFDDKMFVIDAAFENCQIMDRDGEPLMFFGGTGIDAGDLYLPAGIWVGREGLDLLDAEIDPGFDAIGLIVITNMFGPRKVNFYALGSPKNLPSDED